MVALNLADAVKLGSSTVDKVYLGSNLIYPSGPPPPPTPPAFRSRGTFAQSGGVSVNLGVPAGYQAGDYFIAALSASYGSGTFAPSMPSPWVLLGHASIGSLSGGCRIALFAKGPIPASTGEATVAASTGNSTTKVGFIEAWQGVGEMPGTITPTTNNSASPNFDSNTVTAEESSVILTYLAIRNFNAGVTPTWSGGAVAHATAHIASTHQLYSAKQQADSDSVTHHVAFANGQGLPAQELGSILLKPVAA